MKKTILFTALALTLGQAFAQKKTTTSAIINFDATTPIDALPKAENQTVVASLDTKKGTVAFEAVIKNFSFTNPKIQEHFNAEGWMNSDKFPVATFTGTITNLKDINFSKEGDYAANVEGELTMHGVTQKVSTKATINVGQKILAANTTFTVKLADYEINGNAIAAGKVAKEPTITVSAEFK